MSIKFSVALYTAVDKVRSGMPVEAARQAVVKQHALSAQQAGVLKHKLNAELIALGLAKHIQ
jgi:hypothetical protein